MSLEDVTDILSNAARDSAFAAQLGEDPGILTGYDLTVAEREALLSRDPERVRALGVSGDLADAARRIGRAS